MISLVIFIASIMITPWNVNVVGSILLQLFGGILGGFSSRIYFAHVLQILVQHSKSSRYPRIWHLMGAIAMNLGVGVGATLGSLFDLSVWPMLSMGIAFLITTPTVYYT